MIAQIFAATAPMLLITGLGYFWDKRGLPFDNAMVSYLATNVGTPCLLVSVLMVRHPDPHLMLRMLAAGTCVVVGGGVLGFAVLRARGLSARVYLPALMFPNTGNMGIPLSLFAFGDAGLAAAVAFFATVALFQFSLGPSITTGNFSLRQSLSTPVVWAMPLVLALLGLGIALPVWVANTVNVLAGMTIPLMILSLGTSLARLRVTGAARLAGLALVRLVIGFAIGVGVVHLFGLTGAARGAVLIQSSMPAAVFNYLFALRYGARPEDVAAIVIISTLISFLTLPLLLAFVLG
ncbi:MAG: AEC family transporter [Rhodospirillaceae bacterium]|nr:MAG: AEC family transporter [Rhodospirillaceae bacterium]